LNTPTPFFSLDTPPSHSYLPASNYDFNTLAAIYNAARVDYIVPMPMNGKRMQEYVNAYDVDLSASAVALNDNREETGVGMLGLRDDRGWITRLGVIPERRGHKVGQFVMECLLANAQARRTRLVQLEVIVGNEPAHRLFLKLGFQETRELYVLRRPPSKLDPARLPESTATNLEPMQIPTLLSKRKQYAAWTEETSSLLNAGSLEGFSVELPSGENGWIIFQPMAFQISHIVLNPQCSPNLAYTMLYHLHTRYPMQDTKLENMPTDYPLFSTFQKMGYVESFRRIEMILDF
jgi:ribosomal protein S18 acetylase RimI-like enzyme